MYADILMQEVPHLSNILREQ